ncbi:hypothetical protein IFM89_038922 [Coptis chinensis]|uniref:DUF3444 domain-containing protein n=1 Tax=Coptis chinensis TaxID=261450 RepID=A0A835I8J5_9MAGN|nr:hypothetical protein IFM89_038922 [Coptis chinensis]
MDDEKRWCEAGCKRNRQHFEIYPKEGEVWAVLGDWKSESSATAFQIARYAGSFCIAQGQGTYFLSFFLAAKDFNYDWVAWLVLCTCEEFYCNALQSKDILGLPSSIGGFVA